MYEVQPLVWNPTPPAGAFTPAQIQQAYGFNQISFGGIRGDGTGQTIAIVDAQDDPNIQADLNTFDAQFGLPNTTVTRVNQAGGTSYPATDSSGGWELEESLDVEWAHAMAPGAKILLVEANSASLSDLLAADDYAAAHANVVSMSWGGGEFSGENSSSYDGHFSRPGVAFVASSGDSGAPVSWPAASPNVLAVGGTSLSLGANNTYSSETGWSGSGGGPSGYEAKPSYQSGVVTQTSSRANPDVAYNANPNTGYAVYDSFNYNGTSYGWMQIGGTSAGAPQWAALLAIADQGRALSGQLALNSANPQEVLSTLYKNATTGDFHDVTSGTSTGNPYYSASPGYDYVTGIGTPVANLVVQSLVGTAPAPVANDHLAISAPTSATAGAPVSITVTAQGASGATDPAYRGTVHFTSSDGSAALPANYTFTSADNGSHTFVVTFGTAGTQSVTATDTTTGASATRSGISVSPAAPINLAAKAVSPTQVNLSWTASAGDTGFLIERSTDGGATWTQIASLGAGTTSYQDTGLKAGTTYSYHVRASSANGTSAYSNIATATTPTPVASTSDTLWSNSFTPPENAYASGYYEVGVKFTSDVAGTVTGMRFYKQTWMDGYLHVGHLWSSTGQLLASATFTNESYYGWEQVNFSSPVAISPNTVYVVSFSTGGGYFGISTGYFSGHGVDNAPLHALADGVSGGDGVYNYAGSFPNVGGSGMNFWADVVFSPSLTAAVSPVSLNHATAGSASQSFITSPRAASATTVATSPSTGWYVEAANTQASSTSSSPLARQTASSTPRGVAGTYGSWAYHRAVAQSQTKATARAQGARAFGSLEY